MLKSALVQCRNRCPACFQGRVPSAKERPQLETASHPATLDQAGDAGRSLIGHDAAGNKPTTNQLGPRSRAPSSRIKRLAAQLLGPSEKQPASEGGQPRQQGERGSWLAVRQAAPGQRCALVGCSSGTACLFEPQSALPSIAVVCSLGMPPAMLFCLGAWGPFPPLCSLLISWASQAKWRIGCWLDEKGGFCLQTPAAVSSAPGISPRI